MVAIPERFWYEVLLWRCHNVAIFTCHVPLIKVRRKREQACSFFMLRRPCGSRAHSWNECMCGVQLYTGILSVYDDVLITFVPILDVKGLTGRWEAAVYAIERAIAWVRCATEGESWEVFISCWEGEHEIWACACRGGSQVEMILRWWVNKKSKDVQTVSSKDPSTDIHWPYYISWNYILTFTIMYSDKNVRAVHDSENQGFK